MNAQVLEQPSDIARNMRTMIAIAGGMAVAIALIVKSFMISDWLSILAATVVTVGSSTLTISAVCTQWSSGNITGWCHTFASWWLWVALASIGSLFAGSGPLLPNGGVRVFIGNDFTHVASVNEFIISGPYKWAYYVPERIDRGAFGGRAASGITESFATKDKEGIDVRCEITATGIMLDRGDPARLERTLSQMVRIQNVNDLLTYMKIRLRLTLATSARRFASGEQSGSARYVESEIGKDVGATMWVLGLTWRFGGGVSGPHCRVLHSN